MTMSASIRSALRALALCALLLVPYSRAFSAIPAPSTQQQAQQHPKRAALRSAQDRQQWIENSVAYYSKVMRGAAPQDFDDGRMQRAMQTYFAHRKIKSGAPEKAEYLFRKLIRDIVNEADDDDDCDCASLAVPTLLLALLLQREGRINDARAVFDRFFQVASAALERNERCTCSARVFQAYSLFEMKQGETRKSLDIILRAIRADPSLRPVLKWKQFQHALHLRKQAKLGALSP